MKQFEVKDGSTVKLRMWGMCVSCLTGELAAMKRSIAGRMKNTHNPFLEADTHVRSAGDERELRRCMKGDEVLLQKFRFLAGLSVSACDKRLMLGCGGSCEEFNHC